jgi:5'-deoxynucleotidase YfbR-like HD superfamily hydrolase
MTQQNINEITDNLISLSHAVRQFIKIKRATMINHRYETDGEHTLHLQFLAVAYASRVHPELDLGTVSLYCMVHDFVEVYAGDTPTLTMSEEVMDDKAKREAYALEQLKSNFGATWPELIRLVERYEAGTEAEAKFVRTFDKCDPGFTHLENKGEALSILGINTPDTFHDIDKTVEERMASYSGEFPDVMAIRREIARRIAQVAFNTV